MKLNQLRDVLTVAERGSLRAAARHLGCAQPALTRSVSLLERELGVTLFERQAKGMRLTPTGEQFVRRARAVSSELQRAREEIEQLRGDTRGTITFCMPSVPHLALLPYAIRPFRERFPHVRIDILEDAFAMVERELRDGTVDCYVGPLRADPEIEGLVVEKLFDIERVIVGRANHPLAGARSLRELVGAEWVSTSSARRGGDELALLFEQHGLPAPHIAMQARSALTSMVSVTNTDLLTLVPEPWTDFRIARVQKLDLVEPLPALPVLIARRAGLSLTPAAEYFCDMLRRAVSRVGAKSKDEKEP